MSKSNTGPQHITVLLATYNGSRYLPAQLDSLAGQTVRPDRIVVRDDGSSDNSLVLVQDWANAHRVACQVITGPNLGPARCFLIATALAEDSDIFFFCDQDDVWLEDKVERAINWLNRADSGKPALYASRLEVVDQDLQSLRKSEYPVHLSFASAICESLLTGCTMAFNKEFRKLLCGPLPESVLMHDWWCYLLASGVDGVALYYDDRPTILYRQHSSNAVGAGTKGLKALKARFQNSVGKNKSSRFRQLREFSELYHDKLTASAAGAIGQLTAARTSPWRRMQVAFKLPIERQNFGSVLTTRLSILTNRY